MRKFCIPALLLLAVLSFSGCGHFHNPFHHRDPQPATSVSHRWFLDPSTELASYHTYGFLEVTAVRYIDENEPTNPEARKQWKKHHKQVTARYTDEMIWRTLQDEMKLKGYAQVDPNAADLWIVYYGGPRPIAPMSQLRIKPNPFDTYFVHNELTDHTFFIDVIDAKTGALVYRGWDNDTFVQRDPDLNSAISSTRTSISFFPSVRN